MSQASNSAQSSTSSLPHLNPSKIQSLKSFLASDELITILPNFNYKSKMDFLLTVTSDIGPFQAGIETEVPLWLGIYLKRRNLCRLCCPPWMTVNYLKDVLKKEKSNPGSFCRDLPFYYVELAHEIFKVIGAERSAVHAAAGQEEEVVDSEVVKILLEDIQAVRMSKLRKSLHDISEIYQRNDENVNNAIQTLSVTGMGSVEIAAIRPLLETAFGNHFKLAQSGLS
jgi:hypothetical protein